MRKKENQRREFLQKGRNLKEEMLRDVQAVESTETLLQLCLPNICNILGFCSPITPILKNPNFGLIP